MTENPSPSNERTRRYPVVSDVALAVTLDADTGEVTLRILRDDEELYTESTKAATLYSGNWWSENNPERITRRVAESASDLDESGLRTEIRGAFFEAGVDRLATEEVPWTGGPRSHADGEFPIEECVPPEREAEWVDVEQRRKEIQNERYDEWLDGDRLESWVDDPGIGKTTTAAKAASEHEHPHVFYLPSHENAHEFTNDSAKPDGYHHLKGPSQPRGDCFMDAKVNDMPCDTHGDLEDWPRMCPVFERDETDPIRQHYEATAAEIGPRKAHRELGLHSEHEHDWHGKRCAWEEQFDDIEDEQRIVTVQNYLTVPSVQSAGLAIVDDIQNLLEDDAEMVARELEYVVLTLDTLAAESTMQAQYEELGDFAEDITKQLYEPKSDSLSELTPPDIEVPTRLQDPIDDEQDDLAETLAWLQHGYNERVRSDISRGEWDGTPLGMNMLFAACAEAGLDGESARRAIATSPGIDACPSCNRVEPFSKQEGKHQCDECGWHEDEDTLTNSQSEIARATAWIDVPSPEADDNPVLKYREIPRVSDLSTPNQTLILDATPSPELYAYLFGVDPEDVKLSGDTPAKLNAHITQIADGQYHRSTIARDDEAGERLRDRFQRIIDYRCDHHDRVLVVSHKKNEGYFDIPENAEWMHFYAGRGLNRNDCDSVVVLGAPHANVEDLKRTAELLTVGRDDVRVGGLEQTSRRDEDGNPVSLPPLYRKLYYDDETGVGRAIPTKSYTGLVGTLFRDTRESELVQLAHRVRPVTATKTKHLDLLTNVPTPLPIDTLVTLTELSDPAVEQTDLTNRALRFMRYVLGMMHRGGPDGFDPDTVFESRDDEQVVGTVSAFHELSQNDHCVFDVSEDTIRNWLNELAEYGLMEKGEYKQREGRLYTATGPTLEKALLLLSNNWVSKVGAVRRLTEKIDDADGSLDWLEWADETFGLPKPSL